MNPQTIQKLQENIPELKELIAFLASELDKLNTLDGLDNLPAQERDIAVSGKLWAHKTLIGILAPLLTPVDNSLAPNPSEYVV